MNNLEKAIETLVAKAADAKDSGDAMRFAQAALNAAHAAISLDGMKHSSGDKAP